MIGSQAAIVEPRATVRPGQVVGNTDDGSADRGRGADASHGADGSLGGRQAQPIDEFGFLIGPQEEVHRRVATGQAGTVRFAHGAPGQYDPHPGVCDLQLRELSLSTDDLLLSSLSDRAGIDEHEIGALHRRRFLTPGIQQSARHLLRIAPVHLTAKRPDMEPGQRPGLRDVLDESLIGWRGRVTSHPFGGGGRELQHRQ